MYTKFYLKNLNLIFKKIFKGENIYVNILKKIIFGKNHS